MQSFNWIGVRGKPPSIWPAILSSSPDGRTGFVVRNWKEPGVGESVLCHSQETLGCVFFFSLSKSRLLNADCRLAICRSASVFARKPPPSGYLSRWDPLQQRYRVTASLTHKSKILHPLKRNPLVRRHRNRSWCMVFTFCFSGGSFFFFSLFLCLSPSITLRSMRFRFWRVFALS